MGTRKDLILLAFLAGCSRAAPPPPVLGDAPDFSLTDQNGRTVTAADLKGQVWVADFMFTRCPDVCPRLTEKLARVEGVRKISFSVDPAYDTPAVLAAYAEAHHAPWTFLTGATDAVARGFKLAVEGTSHDTHFVLVDGDRKIRGYYDSSDDEALRRLTADIDKTSPRR